MELKTSRKPLGAVVPRAVWLRVAAALILLGVGVLLLQRTGPGERAIARAREAGREAANLAAAHLGEAPTRLQLDVAHENFQKLAGKRRAALEQGVLVSSPDDFVPGRASADGREVRVKLRLKGDMSDHWEDEHKWSFRIVVKGEDTLFGMKQFSVQHPRTRADVDEWFMHEALRREGLPALRYDFLQLVLNGRDLGIYALEEHFEKRLVENRGRREGPIVRFDEDLCWDELRQQLDGIARDAACQGSGAGSWLAAGTDAFQTTRLLADPERAGQMWKALQILDGWRRGELAVGDVFDADLLARHFAVLELLLGHAKRERS